MRGPSLSPLLRLFSGSLPLLRSNLAIYYTQLQINGDKANFKQGIGASAFRRVNLVSN